MRPLRGALVGTGIQRSFSPALYEREAAEHDVLFEYGLIDLEHDAGTNELADVLATAQDRGFVGLNITHPFKQAVMAVLDDIDPRAAAIGAVNTVVLRDGKTVGHNTDWIGFAGLTERELVGERRDVVIQLGAGGAGAAVAFAQLESGVGELRLIDADQGRAERLADSLALRFGKNRIVVRSLDALPAAIRGVDGIVNTTPVGMRETPGTPVPRQLLDADIWVVDVIYLPLRTQLLIDAGTVGAHAVGGTPMTALQAAAAFQLFTDLEPDRERMLRHIELLVEARLAEAPVAR